MHDNNQYDVKLRRLAKDIEFARERASALEDELRGICEEWDAEYEETVRQLRQRVEEMVSGNTFEQIEGVLS